MLDDHLHRNDATRAAAPLDHAAALHEAARRQDFGIGVGLDFGEGFVGNLGDRAVHDFTAVGDVVNTASRLQGVAGRGEAVLSERLAALLPDPPGDPELVTVKGKQQPVAVRRVRPGGPPA